MRLKFDFARPVIEFSVTIVYLWINFVRLTKIIDVQVVETGFFVMLLGVFIGVT